MDWKTIHGYAEEAELWTTLVINCWVLVAAFLYAFGPLFRDSKTRTIYLHEMILVSFIVLAGLADILAGVAVVLSNQQAGMKILSVLGLCAGGFLAINAFRVARSYRQEERQSDKTDTFRW